MAGNLTPPSACNQVSRRCPLRETRGERAVWFSGIGSHNAERGGSGLSGAASPYACAKIKSRRRRQPQPPHSKLPRSSLSPRDEAKERCFPMNGHQTRGAGAHKSDKSGQGQSIRSRRVAESGGIKPWLRQASSWRLRLRRKCCLSPKLTVVSGSPFYGNAIADPDGLGHGTLLTQILCPWTVSVLFASPAPSNTHHYHHHSRRRRHP